LCACARKNRKNFLGCQNKEKFVFLCRPPACRLIGPLRPGREPRPQGTALFCVVKNFVVLWRRASARASNKKKGKQGQRNKI
jgi:hypothetical protein